MDRARAFTLFTEACSLMIKAAESSSSITEIQNDREAENIANQSKILLEKSRSIFDQLKSEVWPEARKELSRFEVRLSVFEEMIDNWKTWRTYLIKTDVSDRNFIGRNQHFVRKNRQLGAKGDRIYADNVPNLIRVFGITNAEFEKSIGM